MKRARETGRREQLEIMKTKMIFELEIDGMDAVCDRAILFGAIKMAILPLIEDFQKRTGESYEIKFSKHESDSTNNGALVEKMI